MTIVGNGQNRKRIAACLPPGLHKLADALARNRMTSVSSIVRILLYREIVEAMQSGEISATDAIQYPDARIQVTPAYKPHKAAIVQSQGQTPNDVATGQNQGDQSELDNLLGQLEAGEIGWNDPRVEGLMKQLGYEVEAVSDLEQQLAVA